MIGTTWTGAKLAPFPFLDQLAACGLEAPTVTEQGTAYSFHAGRLRAHLCRSSRCDSCHEAARCGFTVLRITAEQVRNGVALDLVGRALWEQEQEKRLF